MSHTAEQQITANEIQTQMSMSEEVRSVMSENVALRENLKGTISSLDERNFATEAEIYDLKQQNNALWANVKRENAELEQINKDIQQLDAEYKLELVKRDELSNKNLGIRLVTDEIKIYLKKILENKNTGEVQAENNCKSGDAIKLELETFSQQFDSLQNYLLQERQKYFDELKSLEIKNNDRPLKLANEIILKKNELLKLKLEFEEVMTKINEKTENISETQKRIQMSKDRCDQVQNEIIAEEKSNKEAILNIDTRIAELQKGISELQEKIDNKKTAIEQLNLRKDEVVEGVEAMKNGNKDIEDRIAPIKEKIESLSELETSLLGEIESLNKSIEPLIGVEAQHEELTQRVQVMEENVQDLTSSISSEKAKLESLQEKHVELQSAFDEMKERSKELNEEIEQSKKQLQELASLVEATEVENAAETKELQELLDGFSANLRECEHKIFKAKAVDEELSNEISELETLIQGCSEQKSDLEEKLELLNKKSKCLEKTQHDEEISNKMSIDNKTEELKELTSKIDSMGNLSGELEELEKQYNDLLMKKSSDMDLFNQKKSKVELEMDQFIKDKNTITLTLERDYELVEKDLLEKKTDLLKQIVEIKERIDTATKEREASNAKLSRYQDLHKMLQKQCAYYEDMMNKIKSELNVTKRDIYKAMYKDKNSAQQQLAQ